MPEEEKTEEVVEIKDPAKLLKMYDEAKANLTRLRKEHKELQDQLAEVGEEATKMWKNKAILAEAKSRLADSGVADVERILKYVNLDDLEVDADNNLVGLDEKVETLKADLPELFDVKKRAGRVNADIHEKPASQHVKSPSELQAEALGL
jgi:DNA repair exonuclease SbcCD ATPase subunit